MSASGHSQTGVPAAAERALAPEAPPPVSHLPPLAEGADRRHESMLDLVVRRVMRHKLAVAMEGEILRAFDVPPASRVNAAITLPASRRRSVGRYAHPSTEG